MNETRLKIIIVCLVAIIALLVIPNLVSAAVDDLTFKQYDTVDLKLPCSYKGANCDGTGTCNLTVIYPNGTFMLENQPMTVGAGTGMANYTLPSTYTLGDHPYKQSCNQAELWGEDTGVITITSTGTIGNNNLIPIFLIIFAVLLFILGYFMEVPMLGFFSGVMFLIVGMFMMIYGFGSIADLYTQAFALVLIALGMIVTLTAAFSWMKEYD